MREIAQKGAAAAVPAAPAAAGSALPLWAGIALAASVLIAVTAGSYLFFASVQADNTNKVAKQDDPPPAPQPKEQPKIEPEKVEIPRLSFEIAQLRDEPARQELAKALRNGKPVRFEVRVKDAGAAVSRLNTIFKDNGFGLILDAGAKKAPGGKKVEYLVYMEDVLPYELTMILQQLGREEMESGPNFTSVALHDFTVDNREQVASLLHVPVEQLTPPARGSTRDKSGWGGIFLPGTSPKKGDPDKKAPPAAVPERLAMAFALADSGPPSMPSDEVRRFLQARRAPRPGTLQVVFVLHEASV
jgi:hypothetical protein